VLVGCGGSGGGDTGALASSPPPASPPKPRHAVAAGKGSGGVKLTKIGNFSSPVYVTQPPGDQRDLFVVEQGGTVRVLAGGRLQRRPFLDLRRRVLSGGEQGLLSIAFPPDYAQSGLFYVCYTNHDGALEVDELQRRSATQAAAGSRREVIVVPHPATAVHNGGQIQFEGNLLYIGIGDGGPENDPDHNGQNKNVLLGKILVGKPGRPEIYSYGLRNPWRFSFDRVSGGADKLVIGDVGQDRFEEVDYTTVDGASGANFGWNAWEGFARFNNPAALPDPGNTTKPIFAYSHAHGCSITGGYVVGAGGPPSLRGRYVYADYCAGKLRSLVPGASRAHGDRAVGVSVNQPSSFGEDDRGRIYVCSLTGPVYRLK
jgi:glucose/arabinose dehydrogenase